MIHPQHERDRNHKSCGKKKGVDIICVLDTIQNHRQYDTSEILLYDLTFNEQSSFSKMF